jgi:hypothetical protein
MVFTENKLDGILMNFDYQEGLLKINDITIMGN